MDSKADRLRLARVAAGFSTSRAAAESLGVSYSTYAGHENGSRGIKADSAALYCRRFKVSLDWLLTGTGDGPGNLTETSQNPPKSRDSTLEGTNASSLAYADLATKKGIPVVGRVAAGLLKDVATMNDEQPEDYRIVNGVHSRHFPAEWQYAMDVEGDSMNLYAPEGSLVVCVDVVASGIEVVSGMRVHVQHFRHGGQAVEQTLKTVHFEKGKMVLVPESTNSRWKPIIFNGADYDNEEEFDQVVIKGVVVRKMTDEAF